VNDRFSLDYKQQILSFVQASSEKGSVFADASLSTPDSPHGHKFDPKLAIGRCGMYAPANFRKTIALTQNRKLFPN
jgi:hypothetical protein